MLGNFNETDDINSFDETDIHEGNEDCQEDEGCEDNGSEKLERPQLAYSYKHPEPSQKPQGDFTYRPSEYRGTENWEDYDSSDEDPTVYQKVLKRTR